MNSDPIRQTIVDEEHLKLLSLGYMVSGGFNAFFSLFGLFYAFMGGMMSAVLSHIPEPAGKADQTPPQFVGWIFGAVGLTIFAFCVTFGILKFLAASRLKQRRSRVFCMVVAAFTCLEFPYGTFLGVVTFIVLGRESVIRLFSPPAPQ
jgi:hypothetical protein